MAYNRSYGGGVGPYSSSNNSSPMMYNQSIHQAHPGSIPPPHPHHHQYGGGGGMGVSPPPYNRNIWNMPPPGHGPPPPQSQLPPPPQSSQNINPWLHNSIPNHHQPYRGYQPGLPLPSPSQSHQQYSSSKHLPSIRMGNKRQADWNSNPKQQNNTNNGPNNKRNRSSIGANVASNSNSNTQAKNNNTTNSKQNQQPQKPNQSQNHKTNNKRNWINYYNNSNNQSNNNNKNRNFNNKRKNQNVNRDSKSSNEKKQNKTSTTSQKEIPVDDVSTSTNPTPNPTKDLPILEESEQLAKYFQNVTGLLCNLCNVFLKNVQDASVHCRENGQHKAKLEALIKTETKSAQKKENENEKSSNETAGGTVTSIEETTVKDDQPNESAPTNTDQDSSQPVANTVNEKEEKLVDESTPNLNGEKVIEPPSKATTETIEQNNVNSTDQLKGDLTTTVADSVGSVDAESGADTGQTSTSDELIETPPQSLQTAAESSVTTVGRGARGGGRRGQRARGGRRGGRGRR